MKIATLCEKQGYRCVYCGCKLKLTRKGKGFNSRFSPEAGATIDHIIPKREGGMNYDWNYAVCCHKCNALKGALMPEEFLERYRAKFPKGFYKFKIEKHKWGIRYRVSDNRTIDIKDKSQPK
jgi:5-methylcytosine-specific restriction endonuclease McrA